MRYATVNWGAGSIGVIFGATDEEVNERIREDYASGLSEEDVRADPFFWNGFDSGLNGANGSDEFNVQDRGDVPA